MKQNKLLTILFVITLFFSSESLNAQNITLIEQGLSKLESKVYYGKVKSINSVTYKIEIIEDIEVKKDTLWDFWCGISSQKWNTEGLCIEHIVQEEKNTKQTHQYDAQNRVIEYLFYENNSVKFYHNYEYDKGNLHNEKYNYGEPTEYSTKHFYDEDNRLVTSLYFNDLQLIYTETFHYQDGLLIKTESSDHETIYKYDSLGREIYKSHEYLDQSLGDWGNDYTTTVYKKEGEHDIILTTRENSNSVNINKEFFDKNGRVIRNENKDTYKKTVSHRVVEFTYDKIGNWISMKIYDDSVPIAITERQITYYL